MDFDKPKVYGDTFISDGLVIVIFVECCSNKTALLSLPTTGRGGSLVQIDSNAPPPASSQPVSKTEIGNAQELLLSDFQSVCRRRNTGN